MWTQQQSDSIMRRFGIFLAILSFVASAARAQEQTALAEEVVAVVGNSMILWSEVAQAQEMVVQRQIEQGRTSNRDPRCEALEQLLMQKLLANQARLDSLEIDLSYATQLVEQEVDRLIERYGSLRATEAALRKPIFQIRDALRDQYEELMLAQSMERSMRDNTTVTPSEVERFYRRMDRDSLPMVPDQYVYAQIVMYPPSMEEAKLRARERLLEMRQRIIDGQNFATLARVYSQDGSSIRGGEMDFTPAAGFVRPFSEAMQKLRVGQISPVVETEYGFHIIELLEVRGDEYRVRHILLKPEFTPDELSATSVKLDSIAALVRAGELTFAAAALQYSQDNFTKYNGGEVTNREIVELTGADARATSNRFFRDELYGDYPALSLLKPGDISASYQTQDLRGNQQVKVVMLKEIVPAHRAGIDTDYGTIEDMAIAEKQTREYDAWLRARIASMYVRIDPKYTGCDFEFQWIK